MTLHEPDRRRFLMTRDKFIDWRGDEFAIVERPRRSFRDMFRSTVPWIRVLAPDGDLLFQMPQQRTKDIDLLPIENPFGDQIATLRRTGRKLLSANLFQAVDSQEEPFGTIRGDLTYTTFKVMDSQDVQVGHVAEGSGMTTIQCPDDSERWRCSLMALAIAAELAAELQDLDSH